MGKRGRFSKVSRCLKERVGTFAVISSFDVFQKIKRQEFVLTPAFNKKLFEYDYFLNLRRNPASPPRPEAKSSTVAGSGVSTTLSRKATL